MYDIEISRNEHNLFGLLGVFVNFINDCSTGFRQHDSCFNIYDLGKLGKLIKHCKQLVSMLNAKGNTFPKIRYMVDDFRFDESGRLDIQALALLTSSSK